MRGVYPFQLRDPHARGADYTLCVFCSQLRYERDELGLLVQEFLREHPQPKSIRMIGLQPARDFFEELISSGRFVDRVSEFLRFRDGRIEWWLIGADGGLEIRKSSWDPVADLGLLDEIRQQGLIQMFRKRQGILEADNTFHFAKPSQEHSNKFIRTADALVDGSEIDFLASWLLPFVHSPVSHIYCDTGAISVVAYSLANLRFLLGVEGPAPSISSFHSYEGLERGDIVERDSCLVLISASTAGKLASDVHRIAGVAKDRIVTLFYLEGRPITGNVLCDLTSRGPGDDGYEQIEIFDAPDCTYCREGSVPVVMRGEQFLPHSVRVEPLSLIAKDAPDWLSEFVAAARRKMVIRAHHGVGKRDQIHEIFISVMNFLNNRDDGFNAAFFRIIARGVPCATTQIIHLDDRASLTMALVVQHKLFETTGRFVRLTAASAFRRYRADEVKDSGATVVVVGCIVYGHAVLAISQMLRTVQANGAIVFIVGVNRMATKRDAEDLFQNLTYTPARRDRFCYFEIENLYLPDNTGFRPSIWTQEQIFLRDLDRMYMADERFPHEAIERRIGEIADAEGEEVGGLENTLFWNSKVGLPLRLRPNFAFLKFEYDEGSISQAEVFMVIKAILHRLRGEPNTGRSLQQREYRRKLISPTTFNRLNDGVIQAALLRAVAPGELDFRLDASLSADMRSVIKGLLEAANRDEGEAAPEFVLALALGQLQLSRQDVIPVAQMGAEVFGADTIPHFVCRFLLESRKGGAERVDRQ